MRLFAALVIALIAEAALSQAAPSAHGTGGFNATVAFNQNYDTSAGSSSEVDTDLGYNLGPKFALHAGMPYYLLQSVQQSSGTTARVSGIGDMYLSLGLDTKNDLVHYKASLTGTAPTGDANYGFSTGRASTGLINHLSHDFGPVEPFVEGGIGTSSEALSALFSSRGSRQRDFTTLGLQSVWKAGTGIPLGDKLDLEAGMYDVLPFGSQKLYSREVSGNATSGTSGTSSQKGQHGRGYELTHVIAGDSSIAADHGFTADLNANLIPHVEFDATLARSIHYAVTSLSFSVAYHFGSGATVPRK